VLIHDDPIGSFGKAIPLRDRITSASRNGRAGVETKGRARTWAGPVKPSMMASMGPFPMPLWSMEDQCQWQGLQRNAKLRCDSTRWMGGGGRPAGDGWSEGAGRKVGNARRRAERPVGLEVPGLDGLARDCAVEVLVHETCPVVGSEQEVSVSKAGRHKASGRTSG
jgi:hypothetical protein